MHPYLLALDAVAGVVILAGHFWAAHYFGKKGSN